MANYDAVSKGRGNILPTFFKSKYARIGNFDGVRFIMENMYRVHKINPVGVGKGEVPPLKNYLWKIAYVGNLSRVFWEESAGKLFGAG
jgi:hypothetical protein